MQANTGNEDESDFMTIPGNTQLADLRSWGAPMAPVTILVADAPTAWSPEAESTLRGHGYEPVFAKSPHELEELIARHPAPVAIINLHWQPTGAGDVVALLKRRLPRIELVLLAGHPDDSQRLLYVGAETALELRRPLEPAEILKLIHAALGRRRERARQHALAACQEIFATVEAVRLPQVIIDAAVKALDADDASLMVPDNGGLLRVLVASASNRAAELGAPVAPGQRVAGRVASDRQPVIINDNVACDPRFPDVPHPCRSIRSSIVFPLTLEQRLLGVLNINRVDKREPFDPDDLVAAGLLANQAALALDNVRLVGELNARIAEVKATQGKLVQAERLASIGQLAASVAHEINNPIAYVIGNLEYVLPNLARALPTRPVPGEDWHAHLLSWWAGIGADTGFAEICRALSEAQEGAGRIRDIVNDMRVLARVDTKLETVIDLNRAVRSAARLAAAEIRGHAELILDLCDAAWVRGNPGQLSQVFLNLLINAAQAIQPSVGPGAHIRVTTAVIGDQIQAEVSDTGVGIPLLHQPRIFEPFFTTKPAHLGTGLGLAISRDTVHRHGGDLRFVSQPGRGTTFTLTLPRSLDAGTLPDQRRTPPPPAKHQSNRVRVLFVEDEEALHHAYRRYFEPEFEVITAVSGTEALSLIAGGTALDWVITDIVLPGQSGIDLYERVKVHDARLAEHFIFVTGAAAQPEVRAFVQRIANPVFEKPFDFGTVRSLLRSGAKG